MPPILRIELTILALLFIVVVFVTVNRRKLQMRHSLIWLIISFGMIILAIFPQLAEWCADLVGIQTPSNLIYLLGIIALLILTFSLTVNLSRQSDRTRRIIQMVSIETYLRERNGRRSNNDEQGGEA
ncbi:MAG TPA: DUF2304 domain-containing protein [Candidatus Galloscillospira stercoripullorum]|nr:DUF2304 domain-containing protein [Candidatus Galloscillospira stercoripullorum]